MKCPHYAGARRDLCHACYREDELAVEAQRVWSEIAAGLRWMAGLNRVEA